MDKSLGIYIQVGREGLIKEIEGELEDYCVIVIGRREIFK